MPSKPPAETPAATPAKTSSGVVPAIVACVAAISLAFLLAFGIAVGGYFLSRTERARAQREAAEADRAVAAAFEEASLAIGDVKREVAASQAETDQIFASANELLDRVDAVVGAEHEDPAELRTWSRGDFTLKARFVRLDGENVILRKIDGSEVSVPIAELSAVDQCIATMAGPAAK